jgi:hypothetical protein
MGKQSEFITVEFTPLEISALVRSLANTCFYGSDYGSVITGVKKLMKAKENLDGTNSCSTKSKTT